MNSAILVLENTRSAANKEVKSLVFLVSNSFERSKKVNKKPIKRTNKFAFIK